MKVEVNVLGSPSLISLMVSVDVKQHSVTEYTIFVAIRDGDGGWGGGGQSSGAMTVKVEVAVRPNKRWGGGGGGNVVKVRQRIPPEKDRRHRGSPPLPSD